MQADQDKTLNATHQNKKARAQLTASSSSVIHTLMAHSEPEAISPVCESDCSVCRIIQEKTNAKSCFQWLRHLKDFDASQVLAEKDRQVNLMVDHTDNEVQHIRSRLAFLQTQTVNLVLILLNSEFTSTLTLEITFVICSRHGQ